jgi:SAM-dependent methyltransferase
VKKVLNVGGNSKTVAIPAHFATWQHDLLDIDPRGNPDLLCDARELESLAPATYDAVHCSHNLEHYLHHDARRVLRGFLHVLRNDGFAEIMVPDIAQVMKTCVEGSLDLDDKLYDSPAGPIMVRDVFWGFGREIESTGNDFYAHKTGFSPHSLKEFLAQAGFGEVFLDPTGPARFEVHALAFKYAGPNPYKALFGIP